VDAGAVIFADDIPLEIDGIEGYKISGDNLDEGSAVAFQVLKDLVVKLEAPARNFSPPAFPDTTRDRIGILLCQCGGEISEIVDTGALSAEAVSWSGIVHAQELQFSCSEQAAAEITEIIRVHKLDKVILAACTCCSLDQICFSCTYQRLRCKENLGVFSSLKDNIPIEFVNIREQCAWVHQDQPEKATEIAKTLLKTALARQRSAKTQVHTLTFESKKVFIVGSGAAGQNCRSALIELGIEVESAGKIPEKILRIGGHFVLNFGDSENQADLLVITPGNKKEHKLLSDALQMPDGRSLYQIVDSRENSLDFGVLIFPPGMDAEISGWSAAARINAWISRINNNLKNPAAEIDRPRCRACGTCIEVCGFGIPDLIEGASGRYAYIDPKLCLGCGICAANCPSGAITPGSSSDLQLEEMFKVILT
ncbi:MAG: 4Fe-4S binding protein, partial [Anaerolineales bacterium]|nr:4Fe-4S binding protein [Anaerolineales bacterium]